MLRYQHILLGLSVTLCCGMTHAQYTSNLFLNGEYQNGIKANPSKSLTINPATNIFLEHAIISREALPFQAPTYLPPEEILKCSAGKQCVLNGQCLDGYFANPAQKAQNCRPATHTCCIYRPPPPPPTTERQFDVCSKHYDCVPSGFCNKGEIDLAEYIQKAKSDRCYAPDICCRIPSTTLTYDGYVLRTPEVKFTIPTTGSPYPLPSTPQQITSPRQPPAPSSQPPAPFPQPASPSRQPAAPFPQPTAPSSQPPTSFPQPASPSRQPPAPFPQPTAPSSQPPASFPQPASPSRQPPASFPQPASPSRQPPAPFPQPAAPSRQPPASFPQPASPSRQPPAPFPQPAAPSRQPSAPFPQPAAPSRQPPAPFPQPAAPSQPPAPFSQSSTSPQREYLPPITVPNSQFQKPISPRNEYISPAATTPSRQVITQTAYQPAAPPSRLTPRPQPVPIPTPQNAYIPPNSAFPPSDYHAPESSNTVTQIATAAPPPRISKPTPPQRGEDILSLPLDNRQHLSKCASALECTPENFCNSIGVITDQPVDAASVDATFRVPLTDCLLENGAPGKCCRDANYVDPWPINLAGVCATRNKNTKPQGIQDVDANFGEIPWQAMILKESTKTLLGGGAIIGDQIVLTAASVVKGVSPNDLKVKGGEWELGRDSEPLPSQIVGVKAIEIHPEYNPSTGSNDMAVLRLDKRIEFAQHIKPICVTNEDPKPTEKCIITGWGKQAIEIHEEGAIMHVSNTIPQSRADCGADETSVCSSSLHDPCLFDVGSALACGTGSNVMLKGIYAAENACGDGQTVRFSKADLKWVNGFFTLQNKDILLKKRRV